MRANARGAGKNASCRAPRVSDTLGGGYGRPPRAAVEQALMKPDASLDARLAEAVIAKHRPIFALVRGSPHAAELFSYTHSMAGEIFADLDAAILEMLRAAMAEDPELSPSAKHLARALYFGSADLANRSASAAEMEAELNAFAATHLAGARALAKRH